MGWFPFSMNDRRRMPEISHLLFLLILAVAIFLRFYRIFDIPFTQDEFSAIFRTDYASFGDLINYGVKPDGHPAGIQVLLFAIIRIFGVSRVLLKIPFLLFASIVWLTGLFLIEKKRLGYYLMGGLLILLAYLPHLPVLLHQMKMKGVEDWLAKPDIFFVTDYLAYVFHFSPLLMLADLPQEIQYIDDSTTFPDFREYLSLLETEYLIYAWTAPIAVEYEELVKEYFPYHLEWKKSFLTDPGSNPILVGSVESGGDELIWRGNAARDFLHGSEQWGKAYLSIRLPGEILRQKNLVFKTYLWNRDRADCYVDDFEVTIHAGNQRLYGLFEKID